MQHLPLCGIWSEADTVHPRGAPCTFIWPCMACLHTANYLLVWQHTVCCMPGVSCCCCLGCARKVFFLSRSVHSQNSRCTRDAPRSAADVARSVTTRASSRTTPATACATQSTTTRNSNRQGPPPAACQPTATRQPGAPQAGSQHVHAPALTRATTSRSREWRASCHSERHSGRVIKKFKLAQTTRAPVNEFHVDGRPCTVHVAISMRNVII